MQPGFFCKELLMLKQLTFALCPQRPVEPASDKFVLDEGWVSVQMLPTSDMFIEF